VARAIEQLDTIEDSLANHKEVLNHLLGRSLQTEFSVEPIAAPLTGQEDLAAAVADRARTSPGSEAGRNRMRQARAGHPEREDALHTGCLHPGQAI